MKGANGPAPGALLREARKERHLSIDDVAESLRLSPRVLSALENEDYDALPGPTYIRGYMRSYAQFLGLPAQPLIDAFNARPEAAQRIEMTAPAPVRQITSSDAMVRLGTVLVAVIVFGLGVLWWAGQGDTGLRSPISTPGPTAIGALPAPEPEPAEPEAPAGTPEPEAPVAKPPTPNAVPERTTTIAAPAPAPDVPLSRLVLYVHEDCWADVRDAEQRRLLYETIPAGRVVTVEGVAPISVFLGNVEGVTVEFNGQRYDALRHKRGQVARFTLGSPRG